MFSLYTFAVTHYTHTPHTCKHVETTQTKQPLTDPHPSKLSTDCIFPGGCIDFFLVADILLNVMVRRDRQCVQSYVVVVDLCAKIFLTESVRY